MSRTEEWTGRLILVAFGAYVIATQNYSLKLLLGIPLTLGPLIESQEFRIIFKVVVNRVSGKQVFQVQQSQIFGSNVVGSAREVHFHEAPKTVIQPQHSPLREPQQQPIEPDWDIDDEFTLTEDEEWRDFEFELADGEELIGTVEAEGHVSCYVCGVASFRSFREDETFNPYWSRESVTKTKVSFIAPGARTYYFVIENTEDEADCFVSVKLRVKN